jgi:hypothetical protein
VGPTLYWKQKISKLNTQIVIKSVEKIQQRRNRESDGRTEGVLWDFKERDVCSRQAGKNMTA